MSETSREGAPGRPIKKAATVTAWLGIIQAVLFVLSFVLIVQGPGPHATDQELIDFYNSSSRNLVLIAGLYVMPLAAIAFLWFAVALRMWISSNAPKQEALLSNVQLVSSIVFIALFLTGAAAETVLAISAQRSGIPADPGLIRAFPQYGSTLLLVFAMRMASMFVFTTTTIARKHGIFPRWFVWAGYAVGLFLLISASVDRSLALVFPGWGVVLSLILLSRARKIQPQVPVAG